MFSFLEIPVKQSLHAYEIARKVLLVCSTVQVALQCWYSVTCLELTRLEFTVLFYTSMSTLESMINVPPFYLEQTQILYILILIHELKISKYIFVFFKHFFLA